MLPQALQMRARNATVTNPAFANVVVAAGPAGLQRPGHAPTPVTLDFRQAIGAGDALRSGTYAKTLTFTLSTTTP